MAGTQLPPIKEILKATEVLGTESSPKVVKVGRDFAVKYGADISS
jgi:hypothetical protein